MKYLLFLCMLSVISPLKSWAGLPLEQVVDKIQQKYNATKTLETDFVQSAYNKSINQTQQAKGKMYVKKPGMMRWDYNPPDEQSFIVNDKTFWWYTPKTKQVTVKKTEKAFESHLPLAFISGIGQLSKDFNVAFAEAEQGQGTYELELIPKKPQVNLQKMLLLVDDAQFDIRRVVLYDFYGNTTKIEFLNHKKNQMLKDELFVFEAPFGVQVVEQ